MRPSGQSPALRYGAKGNMCGAMSKPHPSAVRGPSQRQLRVGELIRRTLADVLNRAEVHDPVLNTMSITVGEVRVSPDLKVATVHVMPLGGGDVAAAIDALARNRGELRRRVASEMTLKYAPDLRFRPDETFDALDETRRLFSNAQVQRDIAANGDANTDDEQG